MKEYPFRRYAEGMGAVRQDNRAAPTKKGWWASATDQAWRSMPWQRIADPANFQVFIPAGVRVR